MDSEYGGLVILSRRGVAVSELSKSPRESVVSSAIVEMVLAVSTGRFCVARRFAHARLEDGDSSEPSTCS